eukprot:2981771-Pyramimonas_sp.AAC.1
MSDWTSILGQFLIYSELVVYVARVRGHMARRGNTNANPLSSHNLRVLRGEPVDELGGIEEAKDI